MSGSFSSLSNAWSALHHHRIAMGAHGAMWPTWGRRATPGTVAVTVGGAYEAAARVITTVDSVLDTLIKRMGLVR